jgi:hypothetical protein
MRPLGVAPSDEGYASGGNKAEAFDILGEALYLNRRSRYVYGL